MGSYWKPSNFTREELSRVDQEKFADELYVLRHSPAARRLFANAQEYLTLAKDRDYDSSAMLFEFATKLFETIVEVAIDVAHMHPIAYHRWNPRKKELPGTDELHQLAREIGFESETRQNETHIRSIEGWWVLLSENAEDGDPQQEGHRQTSEQKGTNMLVMAYPRNETGFRYSDEHFKDVTDYNACNEWSIDGDRLEVWYDTEKHKEIVYHRFGEVLCMYDRFCTYVGNDCINDPVEEQIAKILQDEALANGYPKTRPPEMTWRDLMERIGKLPDDVLDMPALVWVDPANKGAKGECQVVDLSPYDVGKPVSEDNRLYVMFR